MVNEIHRRGALRAPALFLLTLLASAGLAVAANEPAKESAQELIEGPADETKVAKTAVVYEQMSVVGGAEGVSDVPGSAHFIGKEQLEEQRNSDIHRILRQVPGISVQEEDGFGLRPNIGMRGTGVERSQKITLLEDGVLIAPAPYAAPAAYYFPTVGRMEGIEVRKGSSSIVQGPYTNGGVLNLQSTSIPGAFGGQVDAAFGDDAMRRLHAHVGDAGERFGWLIETFQQETDGFKDLDGGGPTGFELEDYTAKFRFNSGTEARFYQAFELKLGTTQQDGQETYLGLTQGDFDRAPYRRYAASQRDEIQTDHDQVQLTWLVQPTERTTVTTTAYRNDFFRNWYKLEKIDGTGVSSVLANPSDFGDELAILRGDADSAAGILALRNNRRDYESQGLQTVFGLDWDTGWGDHEFEAGVRYHEDSEDRFQEEDGYQMLDGRMLLTDPGAPGSQANRISSAEALAFFVQDRITAGRWSFTPGLRLETIDYLREDFGIVDPTRSGANLSLRENSVEEWIPGLGVGYQLSDGSQLFGGVHRGFSPPGPGRNQDTEAEESVNYEFGFRHNRADRSLELVAFFNDYSNLLGRDTLSSGGTGSGDLFNGGEVEVVGLEAGIGADLGTVFGFSEGRGGDRGLRFPWRATYTFTEAEFQSSFETSFADWAPLVEVGDEVPYIPHHQFHTDFGVEADRWSLHLGFTAFGEIRTRAGSGPIPESETIDSAVLTDLSVEFELIEALRLFGQVRNLTDEVYVAARRPAGLRPGLPRTALLGLSWDF